MQSEDDAISALTGFSLDHVLSGLSLPSGSGLNSQLGVAGISGVSSREIYKEDWDEDGMVGAGEGEDWEDEIDREMQEEDEGGEDHPVKLERFSPVPGELRQRRVRIVKRRVPRPQTVYERFPGFERDKILDFTELFKGRAVQKSRVTKRPLYGASIRLLQRLRLYSNTL